jgi:hypothetical protein
LSKMSLFPFFLNINSQLKQYCPDEKYQKASGQTIIRKIKGNFGVIIFFMLVITIAYLVIDFGAAPLYGSFNGISFAGVSVRA